MGRERKGREGRGWKGREGRVGGRKGGVVMGREEGEGGEDKGWERGKGVAFDETGEVLLYLTLEFPDASIDFRNEEFHHRKFISILGIR